jgi:hypothetical protein
VTETPYLASARAWSMRALVGYGAAQVVVAASVIPALVGAGLDLDVDRLGRGILDLLFGATLAAMLAVLGARTMQLGRSLATPQAVPAPSRTTLRVAQAARLLAILLGLHQLYAVDGVFTGILRLGAGLLGLLAAGAWSSRVPGSTARGSFLGALAGLLWLLAGGALSLPSQADIVDGAFGLAVPLGAAVFLATLSLLTFAILQRGGGRTVAYAGVAVAAIVAGLQLLRGGFDLLGPRPWAASLPLWPSIALVASVVGVAVLIAAAILGLVAAGYALAHHGPPLLARAGAGFLAPDPGAACPRCGLVTPTASRYCPDCGEKLEA